MATDNSTKPQKKIFLFGKRAIESLPIPENDKRAVYRDERNQFLFLRVTPTATTFFWQKKVKGKSKRTTINFEDQLIKGQNQKPDLLYLLQKKQFNYN